jgi:butyryl-CoA dehydrogenase
MQAALTDIQKHVQQSFKDFSEQRVKPFAREMDATGIFPRTLFNEVGSLGFFGMRYPETAGGSGMDVVSYCLAAIELARGSLSLAASCSMQSLMGTWFLYKFGDESIRSNFFIPALAGKKIGAICMTEPDSGSDLMSVATKAIKTDKGYVLNGRKTWVTSATVADFFTVLAHTAQGSLSWFLVPANTPGVMVGKAIEKMGVRASPTSEVGFVDVELPVNALLGNEGAGPAVLKEVLAEIRIMTAALAVGVGTAAFEAAVSWAQTREQFGKPIGKFQAIQLKIADMAMRLETSRQYTLYAASLSDAGLPRQQEAMMAKLYASESAASICDTAARVAASYGFAVEYDFERYLRDVRFTLIGGGTTEILSINIAKEILRNG